MLEEFYEVDEDGNEDEDESCTDRRVVGRRGWADNDEEEEDCSFVLSHENLKWEGWLVA